MSLQSTLSFIVQHPLNRKRRVRALLRFAIWQIQSRLRSDVVFNWIGGSKLIVRKGMTGTTGNIYCGLHEYADMSFVLHLLRPGDLFLDVGANIGSYTILASAVCGADTIAVEPDKTTASYLSRNIAANDLEDTSSSVVSVLETYGFKRYSYDPVNRKLSEGAGEIKSSNGLFVKDVDQTLKRLGSSERRVYRNQLV